MLETAKILQKLRGKSLGEVLREYSQESSRKGSTPQAPDPRSGFQKRSEGAYNKEAAKDQK